MNLYREGLLFQGREGCGVVLTLDLCGSQERLVRDGRILGYRMMMFGGLKGWALEDKLNVEIEKSPLLQKTSLPANLRLDPGGDMYFTVNDNEALSDINSIGSIDFEDLSQFVLYGEERLQAVGVSVISIYGLQGVRRQLRQNIDI